MQVLPDQNSCYGAIYCTTNLVNGKKYIGQDSNNNPKYFGSGVAFAGALKKYGKENFEKEILQYCINQEDLNESEIYWIDYFGAVKSDLFYNLADGGLIFGKRFKKGTSPWNLGKSFTEEQRKKMSVAHLGNIQSKETKEKRAEKLRGRKRPIHVIEAVKLAHVGMKHSEYSKQLNREKHFGSLNSRSRKIVQLSLDGKLIKRFDCISDAARELRLRKCGDLSSVLSGKSKTAYGFKWQYLENFK